MASRSKKTLAPVYPADAHTLAKIALLEGYLKAAFVVLSRGGAGYNRTALRYVDAFSGAGIYEGGVEGSPLRAISAARAHTDLPLPVHFHFIDKMEERTDRLREEIASRHGDLSAESFITIHDPVTAECMSVLPALIAELEAEGNRLAGSFFFLDQFGYSAVPMDSVRRIMAMPRSEAFVFLNFRDMNQYITDPLKHAGITAAYGGEDWKAGLDGNRGGLKQVLYDTYETALRKKAGAKFVRSFAMHDKNDSLLYWLFFCTNSLKGLFEMKRAMWSVDESGGFRFSDKSSDFTTSLFETDYNNDWLEAYLRQALKGQQLTRREVMAFVLEKTPCYLFKIPLGKLIRSGVVEVVEEAPAPSGQPFPEVNNDLLKFT